MHSLEESFEKRRLSPENTYMLGNLATVISAHESRPPAAHVRDIEQAERSRRLSSHRFGMSIIIDRHPALLASYHDTTLDTLCTFASGGTVADIGAGESSFLNTFDRSRTIAVDMHEPHVRYQQKNGHEGVVGYAHNLSDIPSNSIRLLHASYSAPFWSATPQEAAQAAHEYLRILEPNGIALVGPIFRHDHHRHFEYVAQSHNNAQTSVLPWADAEDAYLSYTWVTFCRTLLASQQQGDLEHGYVDVIGTRVPDVSETDYNRGTPQLHVPNYLMLRQVA